MAEFRRWGAGMGQGVRAIEALAMRLCPSRSAARRFCMLLQQVCRCIFGVAMTAHVDSQLAVRHLCSGWWRVFSLVAVLQTGFLCSISCNRPFKVILRINHDVRAFVLWCFREPDGLDSPRLSLVSRQGGTVCRSHSTQTPQLASSLQPLGGVLCPLELFDNQGDALWF